MSSNNRSAKSVLDVADLKTVFRTHDGVVHAVNGVSFHLREGELLGVVGESGSGKSVTMMSLLKLLPSPPADIVSGRVMFADKDLIKLKPTELRHIRGAHIGFIFQDPMTSLNPVFTVGFQIIEPLREHLGLSRAKAKARAVELLQTVGIPSAEDRLKDYPHQFSGGMRQRVVIAIALACNPKVLIADEPTTALDVTVQAQILELIRDLRQNSGMGIIWITHDLGVAAGIADRVVVMYSGFIVEHARVQELYENPQHPYTRALLATLPGGAGEEKKRLLSIAGQPPNLLHMPQACPFAPRCGNAFERCWQENPGLIEIGDKHDVACWWDPAQDAPRHV